MQHSDNLSSNTVKTRVKNIALKLWYLLDNYYFVIFGLYFLRNAIMTAIYSNSSVDYKAYMFLLAFASFTAYSERRKDVKWIPFLVLCIPFFMFVKYISVNGYAMWGKMLAWQISRDIVIDLNPIFRKIPFNDASFMRIYHPQTLTWIMRMVYQNGFVIPLLLPLYRALISKDVKKAVRYALSGHVFQVFLITPFYLMFHLQEVWYVLGHPDGMNRHLTPQAAAGWTLNCFPSMHTSIAFAMFLLVLREKDKLFKWVWGTFCLSVIFSTMYLEIHWVIDVIGGLILAYCTVKLVDFVLNRVERLFQRPINMFCYKKPESTTIKNYYLDTL